MVTKNICKAGRDDPRSVIHALKVENAIWAVMTVVVVLEFTAGATLRKGFNRGLGTLCAGSLVFFLEFSIFIGIAVFLTGAAATYMRFFPHLKKNYDYGIVIFLLTFNLIAVSSFRVHNVLEIAHDRYYTIAIGCGVCLLMSLLVFPNYDEEDPIYRGYKLVLDSKTTDETLVRLFSLHASWEPKHSCYKSPWKQYVRIGAVLRHFGYTLVALHGCLQSEIQPHVTMYKSFAREISKTFKELADGIRNKRLLAPILVSDDLHEALQDLNNAIKSQPRLFLGGSKNHHNDASQMLALAATTAIAHQNSNTSSSVVSLSTVNTDSSALPEWKKLLRTSLSKLDNTSLEFSEALPFAAFASLLVEMAARLDRVTEQVDELRRLSKFKEYKADQVEIVVTNGKNRTVKKKNREFGTNMGSNEVD
ncbi:hypothetical protein MKX01_031387 [Papaver californicum]|nr:hypothetical protein MKX01_031387 [Papaver californicum]